MFCTFKKSRFVPTTYGLTDFGAGSNPLQQRGWSGWSFPAGLYDPIGYGDGTDFFQDSTTKAKWAEVGGIRDVPFSSIAYGFSYYEWDLSSVPANWEFQRYRINGIDFTLSGGIFPPYISRCM